MSQYRTGTLSVTPGATAVTGTGTAWMSAIKAGDLLTIGPADPVGIVAAVTSDTALTLEAPGWQGAAYNGAPYAIVRDFDPNSGAPLLAYGDINTAVVVNRAIVALGNYITRTAQVAALGAIGASLSVDVTRNRVFTGTLTAPVCALTLTASGLPNTTFLTVLFRLTQDATGSRALGAAAGVTWAGSGYIPGLNPAAGARADIEYTSFDGGASWVAALVQQTMGG